MEVSHPLCLRHSVGQDTGMPANWQISEDINCLWIMRGDVGKFSFIAYSIVVTASVVYRVTFDSALCNDLFIIYNTFLYFNFLLKTITNRHYTF